MRNLKRALSLALASVMLLGMMVVGSSAKGIDDFTDKAEIVNQDAVAVTSAIGMFEGYEDGSFGPENVVTRAEMAVIICTMLYGAGVNVNQFAETNVFTDVPAWAEGYVNLCSSLGIVAGVGDGKFDPNATVTTAQAVLMLCRALGYFQSAGDFGSNWMLAATAKGTQLGLYGDLKLTAEAGLTRDNVAELVFNALTKAVPVQYNELLGVYYNENQGITYSLEFNYLETLGYKNFDLVYRTGDRGDYGRPATTWGTGSYISDKTTTGTGNKNSNLTDDGGLLPGQVKMLSSDEIISVPEPADFTYTKAVKEKDLYKEVGKTVAGYDWYAYSDGEELEDVDAPRSNSSDNYGETAKAVETEVYIDTDEETVTMIYIHNYLAEVSRVGDDEDGDYITVKVPYRSVDEDTIYTTGYDEGEYVVVTVDVDDDGDSFIATVAAPETVEGNVEAVERSTQTKDTGYAVIDDVEYQYSSVTIGDVTVAARENFRDDPELNTNYRLYMDRNGYVIGYIATEDVSKNYLVVLDSDMYMSTGEAKVMLADGTIETVKLKDTYKGKVGDVPTDAKNGGLERAVFSYTVDSKGVYTLGILDERTAKGETGVAFYYNGSTESVQDYDLPTHPADSFGDYTHYNDGTVLDIENETANMKDSSGAKILVDLKTVFVDAEDEVIYTGYDEVPSYDNANAAVVYDNKDNVADIVFIWDYQYKYNTDDTYFMVANWTKYRTYDNDGEYVMRDVYVDGTAQKMELAADADAEIVTVDGNGNKNGGAGNGLYQVVKMDGDRVVEIEPVDADENSAGIQSAANTYYVDKGDKGSKSFELTKAADNNYFGRYTWDDGTIFVTATQDGSNWKVSDGSSSDIWELEDGNTANVDEGDKYSYVYVAKANSKDEAELVYIFNYTKGAVVKIDFDMDVPSNISTIKVNDTLVTGTDISIAKGKDAVVEITAGTNCEVTKVLVNGDEVKVREKNGVYTFTIDNVKKDTDVEIVTANSNDFGIASTSTHKYENGTDVPAASQAVIYVNDVEDGTVKYGETAIVVVDGQNVKSVTVDGTAAKVNRDGDFTSTVKNVTADIQVHVVYFDVEATASVEMDLTNAVVEINGKRYADGAAITDLAVGDSLTFKPVPQTHMEITSVTFNDTSAGADFAGEYTVTLVAGVNTIKVEADYPVATLKLDGGATLPSNYSMETSLPMNVRGGKPVELTLKQDAGHGAPISISKVTVNGTEVDFEKVDGVTADSDTYKSHTFNSISAFADALEKGTYYTDTSCSVEATLDSWTSTSITVYQPFTPVVEKLGAVTITVIMPNTGDLEITNIAFA